MRAGLHRPLIAGLVLLLLPWLQGCTRLGLAVLNHYDHQGDYHQEVDLAYGDQPRQQLDLYRPLKPRPQAPTLIFVPGGCWGACYTYTRDYYRFVADAFTAEGYAVVIADYRLYPGVKFPAIIGDVRDAVDWVTRHGAEHALNTNALVLMGHSAGAHMTALLTLDERYLSPGTRARLRGFIGLAGPYDFLPFTKSYQPDLFGPAARYADSQPVHFVDGTEPPLLLLYGTADNTVKPRNILNLSARVQAQGGAVQVRCYDGVNHGDIVAALARPLHDSDPVFRDILAFLHRLEQPGEPLPAAGQDSLRCTPPPSA